VINISNYAGKDNPRWGPALTGGAGAPGGYERRPGPRDVRGPGRSSPPGNRVWGAFVLRAGVALGWLAYLRRRFGDRWFAVNDTEADWWGWQITKTAGGLGRGYRDCRFGEVS
jgi:hypothetical protein